MDLEQGHIPTRQEIVETIAEFLASRTANPQEMGEVIVEHLYEIKPFPFNSGKEVIRLKREKGIGGGETVKANLIHFI